MNEAGEAYRQYIAKIKQMTPQERVDHALAEKTPSERCDWYLANLERASHLKIVSAAQNDLTALQGIILDTKHPLFGEVKEVMRKVLCHQNENVQYG